MANQPEQAKADVYSAAEIAQAAGVPVARVETLVSEGHLRPVSPLHPFFQFEQAVAAVRALRAGAGAYDAAFLFNQPSFEHTSTSMPVAVSSTFHAGVAAAIVFVSSIGFTQASTQSEQPLEKIQTHLVFLAQPGPGGGGGGGGLRQKAPPPRAQRKGSAHLDSPIPVRQAPKPIEPVANPEPPPPPPPVKPELLPPVVAPVAPVAANIKDQAGVIDTPAPPQSESRGPGSGGGVGTGTGTGLGSGNGSGIGDGSGGGMGGGPYRPGSGITPPQVLKEVKADYTEEARRRSVEGEVVLEIVVRRDGSVGDVRLINGLPSGLNDRAIAAVKQWRFSPAHRLGQAVDVIVEVAVQFKLR
ncbi:MAG TPA: energy transducer TonB [Vicinamibacterales bacterium]|jgi:TonB family protein|nr:energy transducer TonB [Vicinamibacterales bacterium]